MRSRRHRHAPLAAALAALVGVVSGAFPVTAPAQEPAEYSEYQIKAGFLYNFAKLVDWPANTPRTLTLCIAGEDPFGTARNAMQDKTIGDRTLAVRTTMLPAELQDCQMVFFARSENVRLPALLEGLRGRPILTVGDEAGLAARGLIASFYVEGDRVRFEINMDAARRARLSISSRLLNLARIVRDEGSAP
jgi:hypothetical protein